MKSSLPQLLDRKIYKTGQTRGADDDVIYQNRVLRNNTVLIPYEQRELRKVYPEDDTSFEKGFIVLISPEIYFSEANIDKQLEDEGLYLGNNCLVFYQTRSGWDEYNPEKLGWITAQNRLSPLNGEYVARVPGSTAIEGGEKINHGYNSTSKKGAGIRLYEYANSRIINMVRIQLEILFWLSANSLEAVVDFGMSESAAKLRRENSFRLAESRKLLDYDKLISNRVLNKNKQTICPLCREEFSAYGFFHRVAQAEGREVPDLTITELNLFHIRELRYGEYNHKPYNVGWGHHDCNVVTKDNGISQTLLWMKDVIQRNEDFDLKK